MTETVPLDVLTAVVLAESGVIGIGLLLLLGHAATVRAGTAGLRPRISRTKAVLTHALSAGTPPDPLPRLPLNLAVDVMVRITRSIDVPGRTLLASSTTYQKLAKRAGRWCLARRWSRRLKGVRLFTILGTGDDAVPPLLDDPRAEVRAAAAVWLAGRPQPAGVSRLIGMLDDAALPCRLAAHATLVRLGRHSVVPVIRHLQRPQPPALAATLQVASRLNVPALRVPVLAYREHPDPAVRVAVAELLTSLGDSRDIAALEESLRDPSPAVRAAAAHGLGVLEHWPSAPLLAAMLSEENWDSRRAAGIALRQFGAPGRLYLHRTAQGEDGDAAEMARHMLDLAPTAATQL